MVNAAEKSSGVAIKTVKHVFMFAIAVAVFLVLLFSPFITAADDSIDFLRGVSGFHLLAGLFGGGAYSFYDGVLGNTTLTLPIAAAIVLLVPLVLSLAAACLYAVSVIFKREFKATKYVMLAGGIASIIAFLLLIFAPFPAKSLYTDESIALYRVYSPGISPLIAFAVLTIAAIAEARLTLLAGARIKKNWTLYAVLIVPTVFIAVFCLYPILLQFVVSFKDYTMDKGVFGSAWTLNNFKEIFTSAEMLGIIGNTLLVSAARLVFSTIPPIILAILLFDMGRDRIRKGIQTIIYIPHFLSWVIIYAIAYAFISPEGIFNIIAQSLGGEATMYLNNERLFIPIILITEMWKELGWSTILYLAAMSGIDPSLYEAASVDGAGPLQKLFKITLPSIMPIILFLTIMSVGNLLKGAGGEQMLLFGSDSLSISRVIDTWVVWKGLGDFKYGIASAVGFAQSAIGIVMVLICNRLSKRFVGIGLW